MALADQRVAKRQGVKTESQTFDERGVVSNATLRPLCTRPGLPDLPGLIVQRHRHFEKLQETAATRRGVA